MKNARHLLLILLMASLLTNAGCPAVEAAVGDRGSLAGLHPYLRFAAVVDAVWGDSGGADDPFETTPPTSDLEE